MTVDPARPVVLATVSTEVEAAAITTLLGANGIRALATGGYTADFRAEAPGTVQVIVRQEDLAEARRLLESSGEHGSIDWSDVDVGDETE
jgi:hypothetical protein